MAYYGKGTSGQALTDQTAPNSSHWSTVASTDYHVARFIVSAGGSADGANYTTIASAITAATSAGGVQTVFIQPGTYTENLTLAANVNLAAFGCDAYTPNVTILGKCTATFAGTCSLGGIALKTNSDFCLSVTGSSATQINLVNCRIDANNNTAIQYTSSSGSSFIYLFNCVGTLDTTGIAYFTHSAAGNLRFFGGYFSNGGGSATASTISAGGVEIRVEYWNNAITTSSTGIIAIHQSETHGAITHNATSSSNGISICSIDGGSGSALTIGAGATINVTLTSISSSNTNAIAGSGTLNYGYLVFNGTSSTIQGTITQSAFTTH